MELLKGQSTVKLFRELFIGADGTDYLRGIQLLYSEPGWAQTDPAVWFYNCHVDSGFLFHSKLKVQVETHTVPVSHVSHILI